MKKKMNVFEMVKLENFVMETYYDIINERVPFG